MASRAKSFGWSRFRFLSLPSEFGGSGSLRLCVGPRLPGLQPSGERSLRDLRPYGFQWAGPQGMNLIPTPFVRLRFAEVA